MGVGVGGWVSALGWELFQGMKGLVEGLDRFGWAGLGVRRV